MFLFPIFGRCAFSPALSSRIGWWLPYLFFVESGNWMLICGGLASWSVNMVGWVSVSKAALFAPGRAVLRGWAADAACSPGFFLEEARGVDFLDADFSRFCGFVFISESYAPL